MKKIFLLLLLIATHTVFAGGTVMEVIALKHRPAAEIQPLIAPLLDPSDRIIANGFNLIIKTSPENLAEIQRLINKLDSNLINLLITVVQGRNISADDFNASARINAKIALDDPANSRIDLKAHYYQTKSNDAVDNTQTLRTVEGRPAYIKVGKVHPVENIQLYSTGFGRPVVATGTEYIETTTGFAVTPRLSADQVMLTIAPWSDRMKNSGLIETQGAQTTVRARLGEWIEIGANAESSRHNKDGRLTEIRRTRTDNMHILIKVDKAN